MMNFVSFFVSHTLHLQGVKKMYKTSVIQNKIFFLLPQQLYNNKYIKCL